MAKISRFRGDTAPIIGTVNLNEQALNVTGCTFVLTVDPAKTPAAATNNVFALTGTVVSAAAGTLSFPITLAQANALVPGTYYYDIQMVDAAGYKRTIALDAFVVLQDIGKQ